MNKQIAPYCLLAAFATYLVAGDRNVKKSAGGQPSRPAVEAAGCDRDVYLQTIATLDLIGNALAAYATDTNSCPQVASAPEMVALLIPDYLPSGAAPVDGWGRMMRYEYWPNGQCGLASAGADFLWQYPSLLDYPYGLSQSLKGDLVAINGWMVQDYDDAGQTNYDRYKKTRKTLDYLRTALEAYNTDHNRYPLARSWGALMDQLRPDYLWTDGFLFHFDGWNTPYRYSVTGSGAQYRIGSAGSDRIWEKEHLLLYNAREVASYYNDLIIADGQYLQLVDDPELTVRDREKRTMGAMKTMGSAAEAYNTDFNGYPAGNTIAALLAALVPDYLGAAGQGFSSDNWRTPFQYIAWRTPPGPGLPTHYALASAGGNGAFEITDLQAPLPNPLPPGTDDIILMDGQFILAPP